MLTLDDDQIETLVTQYDIPREFAEKVDRHAFDDIDAFGAFLSAAIEEAEEMAEGIKQHDEGFDFSGENLREIDITNEEFKDPWVYFWMRDCTVTRCETRKFTTGDLNDWNNRVHAVIDIRQM